VCRDASARRD
jgi:hypothetical protein